MANIQEALSLLLSQVASLVKKMSDDDLNELMEGKITIDLVRKAESKKGLSNRDKKPLMEKGAIEVLVSQLRTIDEREKGLALLQESSPNKPSLERIARYIDIPISQQDNMETLREKIIEATIGFRLRSIAIKGKSERNFLGNTDSIETKPS
jgi:hypothetical protein